MVPALKCKKKTDNFTSLDLSGAANVREYDDVDSGSIGPLVMQLGLAW